MFHGLVLFMVADRLSPAAQVSQRIFDPATAFGTVWAGLGHGGCEASTANDEQAEPRHVLTRSHPKFG